MKRGLALTICLAAAAAALSGQEPSQDGQAFRFRTGVELVNVTATVTDQNGRFVSGLRKEDFRVYQDDQPQEITHFNAERVPVSLGIVLDTSGSMAGDKMAAARMALNRFLLDLLGPEDEVFLYRFDSRPELVHEWTTDRARVSAALNRVHPRGGTAMYDALADAIPLVQSGKHRKKALVIISDGNDTSSRVGVSEVKQVVRETEVLVYAVGIDGNGEPTFQRGTPPVINSPPRLPIPLPFPGGRRGGIPIPGGGGYPPTTGGSGRIMRGGADDRVNVMALREMTDDSGGRTEIVRDYRDLDPAVNSIADELSQQYYLGYPSPGYKDGRWHTIRVELRDPNLKVRARKGYVATP
jgi:Ca-activated chloride channel family protein